MTKARLKVTEEEQRALKWEHEVLEQRFEKVGSKQLLIVLNPLEEIHVVKYFLKKSTIL